MTKYRTYDGKTYRSELVITGLGEDQGTSVHIHIRETFWSYVRRQARRLVGR